MYIPLPDDVEDLIARKVKAGEYETPSDLLIHAVYLLDANDRVRQQRLEDLRREIAIGIEQCERGESEAFTKETVKRIAVEGRKRLAEEAERLRAEADRLAENAKLPIDETAPAD
jgi:antitoxin ParD1/3/4